MFGNCFYDIVAVYLNDDVSVPFRVAGLDNSEWESTVQSRAQMLHISVEYGIEFQLLDPRTQSV